MFKPLAIAIFICIPLFSFTQTSTLLEEGIEKKVSIHPSKNADDAANNQMLELVSRAMATPMQQTKLTYTIKEHRKIVKNNQSLQLSVAVGNFVHPDVINYLNFPINSYLIPSLISYTYVWETVEGRVLETKRAEKEKFKNGAYLFKSNIPDSYSDSTYKLYLSELSLGFDLSDVKKLDEFMGTVDAYYNADARLNLMEQELSLIKADTLEMLETYFQQTLNNQKTINQFKFMRFPSKLDLDANDPVKFVSHLGRSEEQNKAIKKELEFARDNMHITYYKKGLDWMKWNQPIKANEYFIKSIQSKGTYAPPYIELAQFDFAQKKYKPAIDSCKKVLNNLKPDTDTRYKAVKLAESVVYVYLDSINRLIEAKDYTPAVTLFEQCKKYSKEIPGIEVFSEFEQINKQLLETFYNQMVEKTERQLQNGELLAAQHQIDSLMGFRQTNSQYIQKADKEVVLLKNLYSQWLDKGKIAMENKQFDTCSFALNQASVICHNYEAVPCDVTLDELIKQANQAYYSHLLAETRSAIDDQLADSALTLLELAQKVKLQHNLPKDGLSDTLYLDAKQLKYTDLIKSGDQAYRQNQMREALAFYQEAKVIESELPVLKNTELDEKTTQSAKNLVLILCIQSESFIDALNLNQAQQKLAQAQQLANQHSITKDAEVAKAMESLNQKLSQGKCAQLTHEFNVQVLACKKFTEKREYIFANQALEKATILAKGNPDCGMDVSEMLELQKTIQPISHYQKEMAKINQYIDEKEYHDALETYQSLTKFFTDSCPEKFGIVHQPIEVYVKSHSIGLFIDYGVTYFTNLGDLNFSLDLLNELRHREYNSGWSKLSQEALGTKLAQADLEKNRDLEPKLKVLDYTHSDKWYNHLKKAYLLEWKNNKF